MFDDDDDDGVCVCVCVLWVVHGQTRCFFMSPMEARKKTGKE